MESTNSISAVAEEIVENFTFLDDWMGRYEHIIDLGKELPLIDDMYKTDEYLIRGCQAQVWLHPSYKNGFIYLTADSDAMITKGLIALLIRVLSGRIPKDIVRADLSFLDRIGMKDHLSPTRKNGLDAMIKQIKLYALAFTTTTDQT